MVNTPLPSVSQTAIAFQGRRGVALEGVVAMPKGASASVPGVVLCHGHPALGGSMDAPLMVALAQGLARCGLASLRFNFQGASSPDEVRHDVVAALRVLAAFPGVRSSRLAVAGHSLGASAILLALKELKKARVVVLLSPPLAATQRAPLAKDKRPKLVLVGERDKIVPCLELAAAVQATPGVTFQTIARADHAYAHQEREVATLVADYLGRTLHS